MLEKVITSIFSKKVKKISKADSKKTMVKLGFDVILTNLIKSETEFLENEIMKVLEKSENGII
jgi:accessory gene regulator protein AgrB